MTTKVILIFDKSIDILSHVLSNRWLSGFICSFFILLSYYLFGPHQSYFFSSDQAIHVLMSLDFKIPEDAYYWGQDRLGSLLPLISYPLVKALPIHPILILGLVQFVILTILFLVIGSRIKSFAGKVLVFVTLFFPHPTYYYLLMIGHPYAAQLLFICLALKAFEKTIPRANYSLKDFLNLGLFHLFSFIAIWINDLSIIIYPGCFIWLLFYYDKLTLEGIKRLFSSILYLISFGFILYYFKVNSRQDLSYSKVFIFTSDEVVEQCGYLWVQIKNIILLRNHHSIAQAIFYYLIVLVVLRIILIRSKIDLLFIMLMLTSVLLLFSFWNYRSHFDAKYYIPIYVLGISWIGYNLKHLKIRLQWLIVIGLCIVILWSNLDFVSVTRNNKLVFDKYKGVESLPKLNYLGDYWDVYLMAALSKGRITGISMNSWDCRNLHKFDIWSKENSWLVSSKYINVNQINSLDTIRIYNQILFPQRKRFTMVHNDTCFWYSKLAQ